MANRYFTGTTNGLWSVLTNWDNYPTSEFPGTNDVVFPNGRNVCIDTNVSVSAFTSAGGSPSNGGSFIMDYRSGNITVSGNFLQPGGVNDDILTTRLASGQTITINGNIKGGSGYGCRAYGLGTMNIFGNITGNTAGVTNVAGLSILGSTTFNIVGDVFGNSSSGIITGSAIKSIVNITGSVTAFGLSVRGINNGGSSIFNIYGGAVNTGGTGTIIENSLDGTINIFGDQYFTPTAPTFYNNAANGTINISGNCYGPPSGAVSATYLVNNVTTGIVNIYGDVYASGRSISAILGFINNASTGTINVYGNVRGGISANTIAISNTTTGTINVYGNVSGGTFSGNTPAIYSSTAGFINVYGNCVAGSYPALYSSNTLATNVVGGLVFNTASTPYYAYNLKVTPTASTITTTTTTGNTKIFTTSGYTYGLPFSGDVRSGIRYGSLNEYTGSMVVPLKSSVKLGTLFDTGSTYGEAITNVNDLNTIFSSFTINYTGTT
jgi:hypothetical protein